MAEPITPDAATTPDNFTQSPSTRRGGFAVLGAIGTASLASLCCAGPVLVATLGVGAGLASRFEPLRPVFIVLTLALLAFGFYVVYGRNPAATGGAACAACAADGRCTAPQRRRRDTVVLWVATVVALLLLTFPQWSVLFF